MTTQFTTPGELDELPDYSVILLLTNTTKSVAAQKQNGLWFVAGADPFEGQTASTMASHAPNYGLKFQGIVLWNGIRKHLNSPMMGCTRDPECERVGGLCENFRECGYSYPIYQPSLEKP